MFVYDVTNEESLDKVSGGGENMSIDIVINMLSELMTIPFQITEFIEFICESEKKQDNGVITKKFLVGNKSGNLKRYSQDILIDIFYMSRLIIYMAYLNSKITYRR